MATTHRISTNLWFNHNAEEAVKYYTSIFKDSKIINTTHYGKEGSEQHKMPEGAALTIAFELNGSRFIALNGGNEFKFNEAISLVVGCDTQEEIDYYWNKLTAGGDPNAQICGWCKDKFGVSWQVVPTQMEKEFLKDSPNEKSERVMKALMKMTKIDIETLKRAHKGVKQMADVE
jgi:predicted 3-demethylubiquinone-9 3-methyltransferase (glyoxalase superfamily)